MSRSGLVSLLPSPGIICPSPHCTSGSFEPGRGGQRIAFTRRLANIQVTHDGPLIERIKGVNDLQSKDRRMTNCFCRLSKQTVQVIWIFQKPTFSAADSGDHPGKIQVVMLHATRESQQLLVTSSESQTEHANMHHGFQHTLRRGVMRGQ